MESIPFAPKIQNVLDLVYFQLRKSESGVSSQKLSMRSILPTDQKELVSLAAFKGAKKNHLRNFQQNTNDHFSENILLL
jgi:hypothetical protein